MSQPTIRLTLRTLLAYLDDTLEPADAKIIGEKLAESSVALELVERIRKVTRRRGLSTPSATTEQGSPSDPNIVAAYLSDTLPAEQITEFETLCLESDVHLAEVAATHQVLTLVLSEPARVPPTAFRRMYGLVKGRESIPSREPSKAMSVSGPMNDAITSDTDDTDVAYLLGMSAYSKSRPKGFLILKLAAAAILLLGFFVVVLVIAWPSFKDRKTEVVSATPPAPPETRSSSPPSTSSPAPTPTSIRTPPTSKPEVVTPPTKMIDPPMKKPEEKNNDLTPKPGRIAVAKFEDGDQHVLLAARSGDVEEWKSLGAKSEVNSTDRLLCLPGFRTPVKYESGLTVELLGNMPELVPIALFHSSITPFIPDDGFDADFKLHVGRVYLSSSKANAKVRLRIRNQIWDVLMEDAKTEVAIEVMHRLSPNGGMPLVVAKLFVNSGSAKIDTHQGTPLDVPGKNILLWRNDTNKIEGPAVPDPMNSELAADRFVRFPIYPNKAAAEPTRKALDLFVKRLPESANLNSLITEFHSGSAFPPGSGLEKTIGARFAIFSSAAMYDYTRLADDMMEQYKFIREAAIMSLRLALAENPDGEKNIRALAENKFRLPKADLDDWFRRLRGYDANDISKPETLDQLVLSLSAAEVVQRELAFFILTQDIDPASQANKTLSSYDAGASSEAREVAIRAWKIRVTELKTMLKK